MTYFTDIKFLNYNNILPTSASKEYLFDNPYALHNSGHYVYRSIYQKDEMIRYRDIFNELYILDTKERYLEWVVEWKEAYKELSKMIRMAKYGRKTTALAETDWQRKAQKAFTYPVDAAYNGKELAKRMLLMRKYGKLLSAEKKKMEKLASVA